MRVRIPLPAPRTNRFAAGILAMAELRVGFSVVEAPDGHSSRTSLVVKNEHQFGAGV